MKVWLILITIFLSAVEGLSQQNGSAVLAKVGAENITADEFRNRFEFMPHLNYSSDNIDSIKNEFLFSLIAEKLWAIHAREHGFDTLDIIKNSIKSLEGLFVKDELFKLEVESKIKISGEDIGIGELRAGKILFVKVIASDDSSKIFHAYRSLTDNADFDSVLNLKNNRAINTKPIRITWGNLTDEKIEDAVYSLAINESTAPLKTDKGWFIFKLISDEPDASVSANNYILRNKVIAELTERDRRKLADSFLDSCLGGKQITADRELFKTLFKSLSDVLIENNKNVNQDSSFNLELNEVDLMKVRKLLSKSILSSIFFTIEKESFTLDDFIFYLMYQKINLKSLKPNYILLVLNSAVKQFIEDELITIEGYKRKLDKLESVKNDLGLWRDYYLSEAMMQSYRDSIKITQTEVENVINSTSKIKKRLQINIREILTDNPDDIKNILDEIDKGKNFKELAEKFNKRKYTKKSAGEWGYFTANAAGKISEIAAGMKIGEVYGPIRLPEGYSIFKILDKKEVIDSMASAKTDKNLVKTEIALTKMNYLFNSVTAKLADKYSIKIDLQKIKDLKLSEVNMFTYRLIGFGGKITALPITIPIYEWYYLLKNRNEIP